MCVPDSICDRCVEPMPLEDAIDCACGIVLCNDCACDHFDECEEHQAEHGES